jgi:hypothetical protein
MTTPWYAGQRVLAADLNTATQQGAWTAYTPVWTGASSNPGGTYTIEGYYAKVGRLVTARVSLLMATGTTLGSGAWMFSLPVAAALTSAADMHAGAVAANNSGVAFYAGAAVIGLKLSSTTVELLSQGGGSAWGATVPAAWTVNGSWLGFTVSYESTS